MEEDILINQVVMRNITALKNAKNLRDAGEALQCLRWIVASGSIPIITRVRAENALDIFGRKFSKEA